MQTTESTVSRVVFTFQNISEREYMASLHTPHVFYSTMHIFAYAYMFCPQFSDLYLVARTLLSTKWNFPGVIFLYHLAISTKNGEFGLVFPTFVSTIDSSLHWDDHRLRETILDFRVVQNYYFCIVGTPHAWCTPSTR